MTKLASGRVWFILLATLTLVACGGSDEGAPADSARGGGSSASGGSGNSGGGSAGDTSESRLSDPQIFKVVDAIHVGKLGESKAAAARSQNAEVVTLAKSVVTAHERARADLAALAKGRAVTPSDSKTSLTRTAISNVETDRLMTVALAELDETYLNGQVSDAPRIVTLTDDLRKMTSDADLTDLLQALASMTDEHRVEAERILATF